MEANEKTVTVEFKLDQQWKDRVIALHQEAKALLEQSRKSCNEELVKKLESLQASVDEVLSECHFEMRELK